MGRPQWLPLCHLGAYSPWSRSEHPRHKAYNTLHLVTHSSSIMPLLYLIHQSISVDERDSAEHTALMWAAYQGDALSVDLLHKHGANPNSRDVFGLSPLHWAVVPGNKVCIRRLFEKGADIYAKDNEGPDDS